MNNNSAIDHGKRIAGYAIKETQGYDRYIVEILDETDGLGRAFPPGTRAFQVISESAKCTHAPRCQWHDLAYVWEQRCVVVAWRDLPYLNVAEVIRRLTGGDALPMP
jgi:hypothetical protein